MTMRKAMKYRALASGLALTLALPAIAWAGPAQDWLAAKDAPDVAKTITYSGPPINIKFGHPAPPASLVTPIWQAVADRIGKVTNGKLNVKVYGGGTLLGAKDGFTAVRGGVAEWATCYVSQEGKPFALSKIWEQPFVTPPNPLLATRISQELAAKYEAPEFARQGVVYAGQDINPPADIMSKKPIRKLEDLRGMKIIFQGSVPDMAKALGFTQVNIAYPEIYTALQQGVADAVIWIDAGFIPYKVHEIAKYHTALGLVGGGISHCYNKQWYDGLPPDLQKVFYNSQEPMIMSIADITSADFAKQANQIYKDKGVEMITLSPEEMQKFRDTLQPVLDNYVNGLEKDGVPAKEMLADIRTLTDKYKNMSNDDLMQLSIDHPVQGIQ